MPEDIRKKQNAADRLAALGCALAAAYLTCVLIVRDLIRMRYRQLPLGWNSGFLVAAVLFTFAALFAALFLLGKRHWRGLTCWQGRRRLSLPLFAGVFAVCLAYFLLLWCAAYPGGQNPDVETQWEQVQTLRFNDHHPVFHTLLIWLVSRVCNSYAFVLIVQAAAFAAGLAYLIAVMRAWGYPLAPLLFLAGAFILNPVTGDLMMYALKDMALSILFLYWLAQWVEIYHSRGEWLRKPRRWIAFAVLAACITLVRHNAILLTGPACVLVLWRYGGVRKQSLLCLLTALAIVAGVKGPLYALLKVENPGHAYHESVGLPMTVLCTAYAEKPDELSPETLRFMEKIAPQPVFSEAYQFGDYNSIKWHYPANEQVDATPPMELMRLTLDTFKRHTLLSLLAVAELTDIVWEPTGELGNTYLGFPFWELEEQTSSVSPALRDFCNDVRSFIQRNFWNEGRNLLFCKLGFLLAALIAVWAVTLRRNGLRALWLVLPIVCYNLGTMLLLCGDDYRFFHYTSLAVWPVVLMLLNGDGEPNGETLMPDGQRETK